MAARTILLVAIFANPFGLARAQAPTSCDEAFASAEASYLAGRFIEAVDALPTCLDQEELSREQAVKVYRLLALANLRMDRTGEARAAIHQLFRADPGYRPDPINDPPSYTVLVEIVRRQLEPSLADADVVPRKRSWFRSHLGWFVAGGAAVAGGIFAAVLSKGSAEPRTLPPPPQLPQ